MKKAILIATAGLLSLTGLFSQEKYDSTKFSNIKSVASKIAEVNSKVLIKNGITKVLFAEFYGEFVTSKETSPSAFQITNAEYYQVRSSTLEFGSDYYETLTNLIFEEMKRVLKENNIEVLNKEVLINNPDYIELGLKQEKSANRYTGGVAKQSTSSEVVIRSVSGMGMYSNTAKIGAIGKINAMLPKICKDNGCQAALTANFKIGMGKSGRPTIEYINCSVSTDIGEYNAGRGNKTYAFKQGNISLLTTKEGLITEADISGTEKGTVSQEKYFNAFSDMVGGICNSFSYLLKESLAKN